MKEGMSKKKKRNSLTKNEFILVTFLIVVLELYFVMNYFLIPRFTDYRDRIQSLKRSVQYCQELSTQFNNMKKLKEEEANIKYKAYQLEAKLPPYISQEDIILTLGKYAKQSNVNLISIEFDDENTFMVDKFLKYQEADRKNDQESETEDKNKVDVKNKESLETPIIMTKYIAIKFSSDIKSLYNFIDNLEQNSKKIVVKEITINRNMNILVGDMKLQYIAYRDGIDVKEYKLQIPNSDRKLSPFAPYNGYKGEETGLSLRETIPKGSKKPDFSLVINSNIENVPNFIIGEYGKADTELYYNSDNKVMGNIILSKEKDQYVYTYKLGNLTKKGKVNLKDGIIRMSVFSQPRNQAKDKKSITFDVENNTDTIMEISISNDDVKLPYFILGNKKGKVLIK